MQEITTALNCVVFFFCWNKYFFKDSFAVLLLMGETNRALDFGGHISLSRFHFLGKNSHYVRVPLSV